jgi:hypothetical protein
MVSATLARILSTAAFCTSGLLALAQVANAQTGTPAPTAGPPGGAVPVVAVPVVPATFLVAVLDGRNEMPPTVGDPDGQAIEVLKITDARIGFAVIWRNVTAVTSDEVEIGPAGMAGKTLLTLTGTALPDNLTAVTGSVAVTDPAVPARLKADPGAFFVELRTTDFPAGAVRGQLHTVAHAIDLDSVLRNGPIAALLSGDQEVPAPGTVVGDPAGHATAFIGVHSGAIRFSATWSGIASPTNGHIHRGAVGVNGPVVVPLFAAPAGLPTSVSGIVGIVTGAPPAVLADVTAHPGDWYTNLHTAAFPGGAVRGQLFRAGSGAAATVPALFVAPVIRGAQIYACTAQPGGTFAFTQHNVNAILHSGIRHSFVTADVGPPQWIAADASAVTGTLITRTPNGTGNIAELDLAATQSGAPTGRLANVVEIERLNTLGGVAPAGTCDPHAQPTVSVPYHADYLFIAG